LLIRRQRQMCIRDRFNAMKSIRNRGKTESVLTVKKINNHQ
jgi:hypothetical protein